MVCLLFCTRGEAADVVYPPLVDNDEWVSTFFKGKKLGFSHSTVHVDGDLVTVNSQNYMRLNSDGADQITSFTQETVLTPDLRLVSFSLLQEVSNHLVQVEGKVNGGNLFYRVKTTGYNREKSIPFPPNMAVSAVYLLNIYMKGLKVGAKGTIPVFLESMQTPSTIEYEVLRREKVDGVDAFVIAQKLGGMMSTMWVQENGNTIKEISSEGFESVKATKEEAQELLETLSMSSFMALTMVKPQREIFGAHSRRRLILKMSHLRKPDLIPLDQRQSVLKSVEESDQSFTTTLKVESEPPIQRPVAFPVFYADAELLADAPEIQSAHPQIKALAKILTDGKKDAWQASLSINHWVYKNMEKALVDTVTALDALRDRRGECQSHTNLFVALARAAGIPARVISGLVYSDEYKGFLYHAWPEVYVGEWRALDPTFGEDLVDATHIKLGDGESAGPLKLLDFIGKVGIELIDK